MNFLPPKAPPPPSAIRNFVACAALSLAISLNLGCHAQAPKPASPASQADASKAAPAQADPSQADLDRRIEIMLRNKFQVPEDVSIHLGRRKPSAFAGYDTFPVQFIREGAPTQQPPVDFLVSTDGKTLGRLQTFDLSQDPASLVPAAGRPMRGAPNAPVQIVVFDDLECPFCARMHLQLFPATLDHYKGLVNVAYKDFPLVELHPWAMRAAIDSNCLYAQSTPGYWNLVDYVHAHAGEIGGEKHSLAEADPQLDQLTEQEGDRDKVNAPALKACIDKQDDAGIRASMKQGEALGINATPMLYINGERLEGAVPTADVWKVIDRALLAKGIAPPPMPPSDAPSTTHPPATPAAPAPSSPNPPSR